MPQHISDQNLERYLTRDLLPEELLAADDHLTECATCVERAAALKLSVDHRSVIEAVFLADSDGDYHLEYEQFEAYVDKSLDQTDMMVIEDHTRECSLCSNQLNDLVELRKVMDGRVASAATPPEVSGIWDFLTRRPLFKIAAPAFGLLLIGGAILVAWFLGRTAPNELAKVEPPGINNADPVASPSSNPAVEAPFANSSNNGLPIANASPGTVIVSITDTGSRIEFTSEGRLTGLSAQQFESRVIAAITKGELEISPSVRDLKARSGVLMGEGEQGVPFALTGPVGKVVESDRPRFSWKALTGADSYQVAIYDTDFNKVAESPILRQANWTAVTRLKRGTVYQWQVTAVKDGAEVRSPTRPAPDARFKIIDSKSAIDLETARREAPNSSLVLGIAYANAGMIDEAEREFQSLLRKNPNSETVRRLLNKVRANR